MNIRGFCIPQCSINMPNYLRNIKDNPRLYSLMEMTFFPFKLLFIMMNYYNGHIMETEGK